MQKKLASSEKRYLLMLGDVLILYASLYVTLLLRYQQGFDAGRWQEHFWPFTVVFAILLAVFYIDGLYDLSIDGAHRQLIGRLLRSGLIGGAIAATFFYVGYNRLFTIQPQTVLVMLLGLSLVGSYTWHTMVHRFSKSKRLANGVLIIGANKQTEEIIEQIASKPQLGFELRALLLLDNAAGVQPAGIPIYRNLNELMAICQEKKITTIISAVHPRENPELLKNLFACLPLKVNFFQSANFYEKITGKIPVATIERIWFLENLSESSKRVYDLGKRLIDLLCALILFLATLPAWPLIGLTIKLSGPGSVFFIQERVGKGGQNFKLIKFRTMVSHAEENGAQWASSNDPRVTGVGAMLRATRIDEIPQVINILKGEMSLIGPRPERPEFVAELQREIPFYTERLLIKPGLTGWAQVEGPAYGGSKEESLEKLQYDLFYIKNRSLGLDSSIVLKTIRTVLSRKGI